MHEYPRVTTFLADLFCKKSSCNGKCSKSVFEISRKVSQPHKILWITERYKAITRGTSLSNLLYKHNFYALGIKWLFLLFISMNQCVVLLHISQISIEYIMARKSFRFWGKGWDTSERNLNTRKMLSFNSKEAEAGGTWEWLSGHFKVSVKNAWKMYGSWK